MKALDNSGMLNALEDNLVDRRHPLRIRHLLASQLRTLVLQRAMDRPSQATLPWQLTTTTSMHEGLLRLVVWWSGAWPR